jgi:hypothetical protein
MTTVVVVELQPDDKALVLNAAVGPALYAPVVPGAALPSVGAVAVT